MTFSLPDANGDIGDDNKIIIELGGRDPYEAAILPAEKARRRADGP